ncbi:MAG: hypothetical protein ABJD11_13070 [Gemmatimonadota bacterium]
MSDKPRDWDKEMAAIDREIAKAGSAPRPAVAAQQGGAAPVARASNASLAPLPGGRKATIATWSKVILAVLLAVAMPLWPYPHTCGLNLFIYLGAISVVILAGLWSSVSSWYRRIGLGHTLALLVITWGVYLAGSEVLPRIGYAKSVAAWFCGP